MPASLNKVMVIGNLTRDPELRYIPSGKAVTSFTVAANSTYMSQSGEKKDEVSFIRVVVWARRAEVCNEYLKKGSPVFVEGRLQSRSWEAQDGSKRSTIEVIAQNVQFLSSGSKNSQSNQDQFQEETTDVFENGKSSVQVSEKEMQPDDEIPF